MPDNEYDGESTTGGLHIHNYKLQSTETNTFSDKIYLVFECDGCESASIRTLSKRLTVSDDPPPGYHRMPLREIERWLDPEDIT